jgi:magnesium transporter
VTLSPQHFSTRLLALDARTAAGLLDYDHPNLAAQQLAELPPARAMAILMALPEDIRDAIMTASSNGSAWLRAEAYALGTVGSQLEEPIAAFRKGTSVAMAVDLLRELMPQRELNQVYVVDPDNRLLGTVAFKELLFAERGQSLDQIMQRNPCSLRPEWPLNEAIARLAKKPALTYPICDADGILLGQVDTHRLHEQQAFELSGQPGYLVGIDHDEQWASPWLRKLQFRQPWLQIHLLMLFVVGYIITEFQEDIAKAAVLAVFLPIVAGLCRTIGSQAMACTLRGLSLCNPAAYVRRQIIKETWLGLLSGILTGALAGIGMYIITSRHPEYGDAQSLALVTMLALSLSCMLAALLGAGIPFLLRKLGFNPAMAANLVMSGLSDMLCIGLFLTMAVAFVL